MPRHRQRGMAAAALAGGDRRGAWRMRRHLRQLSSAAAHLNSVFLACGRRHRRDLWAAWRRGGWRRRGGGSAGGGEIEHARYVVAAVCTASAGK